MKNNNKLFLYSLSLTQKHFEKLEQLADKKATDIHLACIENAADIIDGSEHWIPGIRQSLTERGYQTEPIDLRNWFNKKEALQEKLKSKDIIWVGGGHTYYLRWILKQSGADDIIKELVDAGKIYAGWSAGAIMAGPTTRFFDLMGDNPADAAKLIEDGIGLTNHVIVPHMDNADFATGAVLANTELLKAGFKTVPLNDDQACVIEAGKMVIL